MVDENIGEYNAIGNLEFLDIYIYILVGAQKRLIFFFKKDGGECNEWERLNLIIFISWGVQKSKREIENVNIKGKDRKSVV